MNDPHTFGTWHKRRRKALGLTQDGLARLVGCSAVTIKKIESDDLQASVQLVELIATHLQIPADERPDFIEWARGGKGSNSLSSVETTWQSHSQPAQAPLPRRASSLPAQLTRVIGREREIEVGCGLLAQSSTRVLTLTGPPGIGKTRLAIEIADAIQNLFNDGVWFIGLAAVNDPALIPSSIAHDLGVRELPNHAVIDTLQDYLRDKQILLVLDNFEHLIKAASVVRDLLVTTTGVKVIVTSREVLHLYGEQEFAVSPLALPDLRQQPDMEQLESSPAVALFIERAKAVMPDFRLNADNAATIVEICARLDGLPLAVEMAAARVKWLTPRALLTRLSQRLDLLNSGSRDMSARQQTLRGAIDWSYDLLDPEERKIFARFSVFANGADSHTTQVILDTKHTIVEANAVTDRRDADREGILRGLQSLTDKSLLHISFALGGSAPPRFIMLETLREYAYDKLSNSGEAWTMRDRHLAYYVVWAADAEKHLHGPDQIEWLDRIEAELDNLRAALDWALDNGDAGLESGLRLAGALGWFWRAHGHLSEGLKYLRALLKQTGAANTGMLRARALSAAGMLAYYQAEYDVAAPMFEESLTISRGCDDRAGIAYAMYGLANCVWYQGNQTRSLTLHEESVSIYQAIKDRWGTAIALSGLASVLGYQGDFIASRRVFEECLAIGAAIGDKWVAAFSLWSLGDVMYGLADYVGAGESYAKSLPFARELGDKPSIAFVLAKLSSLSMQEDDYVNLESYATDALRLFREMGDKWQTPFLLRMLGYVALRKGQDELATHLCEESLNHSLELGDERGVIANLVGLASVEIVRGSAENLLAAARLFGAVDTLLSSRDIHLLPPDMHANTINNALLRGKLDGSSFQAAYAIGCTLNLRQVIAMALNKPQTTSHAHHL